jgi:hypothetical protein
MRLRTIMLIGVAMLALAGQVLTRCRGGPADHAITLSRRLPRLSLFVGVQ